MRHVAEEVDRDLVGADRLDRLVETDLAAIELDALLRAAPPRRCRPRSPSRRAGRRCPARAVDRDRPRRRAPGPGPRPPRRSCASRRSRDPGASTPPGLDALGGHDRLAAREGGSSGRTRRPRRRCRRAGRRRRRRRAGRPASGRPVGVGRLAASPRRRPRPAPASAPSATAAAVVDRRPASVHRPRPRPGARSPGRRALPASAIAAIATVAAATARRHPGRPGRRALGHGALGVGQEHQLAGRLDGQRRCPAGAGRSCRSPGASGSCPGRSCTCGAAARPCSRPTRCGPGTWRRASSSPGGSGPWARGGSCRPGSCSVPSEGLLVESVAGCRGRLRRGARPARRLHRRRRAATVGRARGGRSSSPGRSPSAATARSRRRPPRPWSACRRPGSPSCAARAGRRPPPGSRGQALAHVLGHLPPAHDVEEARRLLPLLGLAVLPAAVDRQAEARGRLAGVGEAQLGVPGDVADQGDAVVVAMVSFLSSRRARRSAGRARPAASAPPVRLRLGRRGRRPGRAAG